MRLDVHRWGFKGNKEKLDHEQYVDVMYRRVEGGGMWSEYVSRGHLREAVEVGHINVVETNRGRTRVINHQASKAWAIELDDGDGEGGGYERCRTRGWIR